jgi:hypothetical protein
MRRPISLRVFAFALVFMLASVGSSVAGATKPSLTVRAPTSVVNEAPWSVVVSGFSGPYSFVMVAKERGEVTCRKPEAAYNKKSRVIAKQHKFKVTFSELQITGNPPQIFTMCTYLYRGSKYVVKVSHYQIVPTKAERESEG